MINHFHLPDLPNAGYSTDRERRLSDAVMQFMREMERDRLRLLTIVVEGIERWRAVAGEIWRPYRIGEDHELLDSIYHYFELQAVRPGVQAMLLKAQQNPATWKDIMTAARPHLEKEREGLRLMEKWR
jgi:hypothetical protein